MGKQSNLHPGEFFVHVGLLCQLLHHGHLRRSVRRRLLLLLLLRRGRLRCCWCCCCPSRLEGVPDLPGRRVGDEERLVDDAPPGPLRRQHEHAVEVPQGLAVQGVLPLPEEPAEAEGDHGVGGEVDVDAEVGRVVLGAREVVQEGDDVQLAAVDQAGPAVGPG